MSFRHDLCITNTPYCHIYFFTYFICWFCIKRKKLPLQRWKLEVVVTQNPSTLRFNTSRNFSLFYFGWYSLLILSAERVLHFSNTTAAFFYWNQYNFPVDTTDGSLFQPLILLGWQTYDSKHFLAARYIFQADTIWWIMKT